MENSNISQRSPSYNRERYEPKCCWVCFETNDDDYESNRIRDWVSPCKCRGSRRWVHQDCINNNETQCSVCQTQYIFVYDEVNYFVQLLNKLDTITKQLSPFLSSVIGFIGLYWSAASYGAITMMQVLGEKEAITIMKNTDRYMLILVLPSIPLSLILAKTINWEETLLLFFQSFTSQLPLLRTIMPSFLSDPVNSSMGIVQLHPVINPMLSNSFYTALLLPSIATVVGSILFVNSSYSYLQKTLLGGLVYIIAKGVLRIYLRQQSVIRERTRSFVNYSNTEENN